MQYIAASVMQDFRHVTLACSADGWVSSVLARFVRILASFVIAAAILTHHYRVNKPICTEYKAPAWQLCILVSDDPFHIINTFFGVSSNLCLLPTFQPFQPQSLATRLSVLTPAFQPQQRYTASRPYDPVQGPLCLQQTLHA